MIAVSTGKFVEILTDYVFCLQSVMQDCFEHLKSVSH
ncbi:hypothetical protein BLA3211_01749 [Burkholderia aenigmatica]|uniref:Uncharacterized protein n=1 Tax=Burkholderia aenigmatica TaxID=2015348 RepID=A0A6J5IWF7_9BURK|nr:hypothetical protein BLA3211_01749 [Burkholderia aenigmatica]VWC72774.1 hypothetical protein BLA17378_03363 [Burkholderia aenigmatica]VWD27039.1 hypothetical protein BLA18628_04329 [Burkholderia aenigmatica]